MSKILMITAVGGVAAYKTTGDSRIADQDSSAFVQGKRTRPDGTTYMHYKPVGDAFGMGAFLGGVHRVGSAVVSGACRLVSNATTGWGAQPAYEPPALQRMDAGLEEPSAKRRRGQAVDAPRVASPEEVDQLLRRQFSDGGAFALPVHDDFKMNASKPVVGEPVPLPVYMGDFGIDADFEERVKNGTPPPFHPGKKSPTKGGKKVRARDRMQQPVMPMRLLSGIDDRIGDHYESLGLNRDGSYRVHEQSTLAPTTGETFGDRLEAHHAAIAMDRSTSSSD